MITWLRLVHFKNFDRASLHVGPFTVIVGANASGKSNIRDALRFLHGIGRGYTFAEILGGKLVSGQFEWEPIRGAHREIVKIEEAGFAVGINLTTDTTKISYTVTMGREVLESSRFRVWKEQLKLGSKVVYERTDKGIEGELATTFQGIENVFVLDKPILSQFSQVQLNPELGEPIALTIDALSNIRFLDLVPNRMRQPSFPGQVSLGDGGENLPSVLQALCADPVKKEILAQWTQELTPMDINEFDFREGPDGRLHLILQERDGREISAQSASDGTLRFLAMLAALLGPDPAQLYFFEEIDNGIHPSRLNLLIDLIEQQTAKGEIQVIATTHSPQLLSMIGDTTFKTTSVVCRLEDSEDAIIRRVADLPNAKELRESQGLGRLLAGGWMEDALAFTEGNEDMGMDSE